MMNSRRILWKNVLLAGLSCVMLINSSCIDYIDNVNPDGITEDMMAKDNLKTGSFFAQMLRNVVLFNDGSNLDSDYQVAQAMVGDIFAGYVSSTYAGYNGVHNASYYFISGWTNMMFEKAYTNIMAPWNSLVTIADEQGLSEVSALATVVKVAGMHRVADTYGPILYCNYGSSSTLSSTYDSLEDIYKRFFEELDEAIDVLTNYVHGNVDAALLENYDLVYGGDVQKWVKFANTLRLRLAMRVYYADATLAQTEAEKSIQNSIGVITAKSDRTELQHTSALIYHHPLYEIAYDFNNGEARMSAAMDSYLNGYNDPRLSVYFKAASSDGGYHGVRIGITPSSWGNYSGNLISNLNMDDTSTPITWMTAAESYFLRAEGAVRGWNMGGTAEDLYNQGIETSMDENGVSSAYAAYVEDKTSTPANFEDVVGSESTSALSSITIAWDDTESDEVKQERIITQKWIAMYPDGPEGWAEFRRTGYPKLFPVVHNNSNGTIDTDIQVRRSPYPQSEYTTNATGVATGVAKLGGQDNGGTKLWWDKK